MAGFPKIKIEPPPKKKRDVGKGARERYLKEKRLKQSREHELRGRELKKAGRFSEAVKEFLRAGAPEEALVAIKPLMEKNSWAGPVNTCKEVFNQVKAGKSRYGGKRVWKVCDSIQDILAEFWLWIPPKTSHPKQVVARQNLRNYAVKLNKEINEYKQSLPLT